MNFFFPILKNVCPLFVQIAQMGLILPRWDLILPRIPPSTPLLYSAVTHLFRGYVHTQSTPKPTQNTPFPGLNLKVGKMNYSLGNSNPNWAKCLKSGQNISRSGPKKFIHKLETHPVNAGHYMAFKHSISFATDLAETLVAIGLKLELCRLTNWLERFYLLPDQWINCAEFEFFLKRRN